jgi:succinate dehydrogenase/fumarate reductase cytochrome b subunit
LWFTWWPTGCSKPSGWRFTNLIYDSAIHTVGLLLVFPWPVALLIGISHLLIDTRKPLIWWLRFVKRMPRSSNHQNIEVWVDQVMHITVLALVALVLAKGW